MSFRAYVQCEICHEAVQVSLDKDAEFPTIEALEQEGWRYLGMSADQSTVRWVCAEHAPPDT